MEDRRKHQRFEVNEKCLVRHAKIVGTVVNLSLGGLSCWCLNPDECPGREGEKVDIYCIENQTWIRDLNLEILDSEKVSGKFLDNLWVRKCRARFADLHQEQANQLADIIVSTAVH